MNYFVTGATGFIGRHLVAELLKRDATIYLLVREGSRGKLAALAGPGGRLGRFAFLGRKLTVLLQFGEPVDSHHHRTGHI